MKWGKYRLTSGVIDLQQAFDDCRQRKYMELDGINRAIDYLVLVEQLHPISSRQAAAIAIANAIEIGFSNG